MPDVTEEEEIYEIQSKEPMSAEYRAWLYGVLGGLLLFFGTVVGVTMLITHSDEVSDKQKTGQVEACSHIRESNASFLCVEQIDD